MSDSSKRREADQASGRGSADPAAESSAAATHDGRASLRDDLDRLDAELFRSYLGTTFSAGTADGTQVALELEEVADSPRSTMPGAHRTAFSLILRGSWDELLEGGHYHVTHPQAGDFGALYLTTIVPPRGSQDDRAAYQIVFN